MKQDRYIHKGLRRRMIDEIRKLGIADELVLQALDAVPRHFFVEAAFEERIYKNTAFPIEAGQTISQPYTVAYQTMQLGLKPGHKVLEVGTGSGYQAAVLAALGTEVHSIERQELLHESSKKLLAQIAPSVRCYLGDGQEGLLAQAPFDAIIVTAAAKELPRQLLKQLRTGGRMIIPVGDNEKQQMQKIYALGQGDYELEYLDFFRFVPLLSGLEPKR